MNLSAVSALLLTVQSSPFSWSALAFSGAGPTSLRRSFASPVIHTIRLTSSAQDEIEALRAKAAKARAEAATLAKELGRDIEEAAQSTKKSGQTVLGKTNSLSSDDVLKCLSSKDLVFDTDFEVTAESQDAKFDELVKSGDLSLWKSAVSGLANTNSPGSLRTYPVSLDMLSSRTGGVVTADTLGVGGDADVSLEDFKDATIAVTLGSTVAAFASLAFLPENIGATFCYLFALIPVGFIGIGSTAPGIIAGGISSFKGTADDAEKKEARICAHEAGHFLCGYLCGLPIKQYSVTDNGFPCVEFYPSGNSDANDNRREFTKEEIAALSVVAMSGSVAEVLQFGQARGGENDLIELDTFFRRSKEFIGAQRQQDLTRWGALVSHQLIKGNYPRYERLIQAFKERLSVAQCIAAIESDK